MIEQRGLFNHLLSKISDLELSASDVVAQTSPQSFVISVWQFLAPLMVGGRVHICADEEARDLGRRYYPAFFALQADHYEADANPWTGIPEYADFNRMFANLRKMTDPAELGPFLDSNLVGTRETICKRIDSLIALGFNYFMVSCATPGTPFAIRQRMMTRFAEEVCPHYSKKMRKASAA